MKPLHKIFLILIAASLFNSCNTTDPTDDLKPGRRDYTWTVDTLANIAPSNSYTELWGYDPQHVWLAGDSWDLDKNILEFNGIQWGALPLPSQPPSPAPWALWGTDANNIWAAGYSIWKFDGSNFNYFDTCSFNGFRRPLINDIYGKTINNLYAVGNVESINDGMYYPFILKYDNNKWKNIVLASFPGVFLNARNISTQPDKLYLLHYSENPFGNDTIKVLLYTNSKFYEIYNNSLDFTDVPFINEINGQMLMGGEKNIYSITNISKNLIFDFSTSNKATAGFWGRNTKDLFFESYGGLGHYNGDNIQILYPINKTFYIMNCIFFEKEVFILYYEFENFKFYVLRGKLN